MSEQPHNSEVNPNKGDGSTSDPNWHGDAGDQANDLRFAEEQQLINSQAQNEDTEGVAAGGRGGYTNAQRAGDAGDYTEGQDQPDEGEYTDVDGTTDADSDLQGEYTDADSVPSLQEGGDAEGTQRP